MRRMVVWRSDLDDVGQRRRARLGTRSDTSRANNINSAAAGFVSPVLCCQKQPSGASHTSVERFRGVCRLFVRVVPIFPFTALPPDAPPRT